MVNILNKVVTSKKLFFGGYAIDDSYFFDIQIQGNVAPCSFDNFQLKWAILKTISRKIDQIFSIFSDMDT